MRNGTWIDFGNTKYQIEDINMEGKVKFYVDNNYCWTVESIERRIKDGSFKIIEEIYEIY